MLSSATELHKIVINQQITIIKSANVQIIIASPEDINCSYSLFGMSREKCIEKVSGWTVHIELQQNEDVHRLFRSIVGCCRR